MDVMRTGFGKRTQGNVRSKAGINFIHAQVPHEDILLGLVGPAASADNSLRRGMERLP